MDAAGPASSPWLLGRERLRLPPTVWVAILVASLSLIFAVFAPQLTGHNPVAAEPVQRLQPFNSNHLLGTDQLGRDVFARIIYGARLAWIVGFSIGVLSLVLGSFLGLISGYARGWIGQFVTRLIDGVMAFPPILLALILATIFSPSTKTAIVALGIVYSPFVARVMRGVVMKERELAYVTASRGIGNREIRTVLRHILPSTTGPMLVVGTIVLSRSIIIEASLSFLGAGTQAPAPSWGVMIIESRELLYAHPRLFVVPAVALSLLVLSINVIADYIGDRLGASA